MVNISLLSIGTLILLAPLLGAVTAGLLGPRIGHRGVHTITILGVVIALLGSMFLLKRFWLDHQLPINVDLYQWGMSGSFHFDIGFMLDHLSASMAVTVSFVSLLVHIYSIGYMKEDPGYTRFFSYMSLFTFAMLTLVLSNNFLQLYFGWEGVGFVSYLLIGFWFHRESAVLGSLKAFIVNRVGDMGFILGIATILGYFNSLDYAAVFTQISAMSYETVMLVPGLQVSLMTLVALLLLIGAIAKSAQIPLHVWLPESMEGPTPISALIHAATMVTAGIFMVVRLSPLFEASQTVLSVMLIVGGTTALLMGVLAFVQYDIKRIIAYSTLSQLGYMMAALGASAFAASIFHLLMHACFKALLFLAAGSVIVAMHHEQDIRKMGGLWRRLPITYFTFLLGALSMSAFPPFSGFYSKESIIDAIHLSTLPGASYAYLCVLIGAFVTAFYTFRLFFMTFHTKTRIPDTVQKHLKEASWVIWLPLVLLAVPSVMLGGMLINETLYTHPGLLGDNILVASHYNVMAQLSATFEGAWEMAVEAPFTLPFWLSIAGFLVAWLFYIVFPKIPVVLENTFPHIYRILSHKYGFDTFNEVILVNGTRRIAGWLFQIGDVQLIDDGLINGSGHFITWLSKTVRRIQSGYLYHYALIMLLGLLVFVGWLIV